MRALDVRLAVASAAVLWFVAACLLGAAAIVEGDSTGQTIAMLAGAAILVSAVLAALLRGGRESLTLAWLADLAAIGLVAGLVGATGGADSVYSPFFLLPVLHAAVFQPRWRVLLAGLAAVGGLFAPLVYDDDTEGFAEIAAVGLLPAIVVVGVAYLAVEALRRERESLADREAEALRIAESDALTGIGNYRRFWRQLEAETARSRRHEQPFSLIVLDLDGFKAINDELGHQAGDEALRRVARALETQVRTEDVLCRQGGDEFAVIAVAAGPAEASELARRLIAAVSRASQRELSHALSASTGVATFGEPERTAEGLLAQADRALREAKRGEAAPDPEGELAPAQSEPWDERSPSSRRLSALSACSRALALAEDERAVVQVAVVHVAEALEARSVELWRRDGGSGRPLLVARGHHTGASSPAAHNGERPVEPALLHEVIESNHVLSVEDGAILVPISHGGRVDGVLVIRGQPGEMLSVADRQLALAIAAQIGRALAAAGPRAELAGAAEDDELERVAQALGTAPSSVRVADLAESAGRVLGLRPSDLATLRQAALLHDVGMLGVPAGLPLRPAPLSTEEVAVLREHPLIAERLLRPMPRLSEAAWVLRHAHERHDGTGYPDGLGGDDIPLPSRVLHAAIAFEAMLSARPWREPLEEREARAELRRVAGRQLDPVVVEAFLAALDRAGRARAPVS